ncbi:MAG: ATP-binding protein [Anaerolineales bacterium]|nr:ATP-binding protein [Anaerolineales bacterium]MDW8447971.1 ATP-binding protein [Anaerolineales bacterium]
MATSTNRIALLIEDDSIADWLTMRFLQPAGYQAERLSPGTDLKAYFQLCSPSALIVDSSAPAEILHSLAEDFPLLPLIYYASSLSTEEALQRYQEGFQAVITAQDAPRKALAAIHRVVARHESWQRWVRLDRKRHTQPLERHIKDLERLHRIGGKISASLSTDQVLREVVVAAVELTGAEEGNLMLLEEESGNLLLRAAHSVEDRKTSLLCVPVYDTLLGEVIATKRAINLSGSELTKIKTAFLVRALIYVPLLIQEKAIGVLGVYNREGVHTFSDYHQKLLETLADYAAIAIQNAKYYTASERERQKLYAILTHVRDGVIVLDEEQRVLLINEACRQALNIKAEDYLGKPVDQVLFNSDLVLMLKQPPLRWMKGGEIRLEDGRILDCQVSSIAGVGLVVTLHDITHLKELDRAKSEFVSAVSHDLRSPLTAILGYTELIAKVGPLNERQQEFIKRVQASVRGITALIADLLDLGRIEAGMDAHKELIDLRPLLHQVAGSYQTSATAKDQQLEIEISPDTSLVWGNPVRLEQMIANLLSNAIKYTPRGGKLGIRTWSQSGQLILQVWDKGIGIPPAEQPYIFDKFYRASNLPEDIGGTGLGLTIVKSIVEDHQGRIWVESTLGEGTTFTVVLPAAEPENLQKRPK